MPTAYQTPTWNTHREVKLRELDFPLFDGDQRHFTVTRMYEGPLDTYVAAILNAADATYSGAAVSVTGTAATDLVTYAAAHGLQTGDKVTLTITSGLAGLVTATDYFAIRVSSTTIKLATTAALAYALTAINITSDGTGTLAAPLAYFVRQGTLRDREGAQVGYERLFANVPQSWDEPEEFAYTYPAVLVATALGTAYTVTAMAASGANTVLSSSTATGIAANDTVLLNLAFTRPGYPATVRWATFAKVASVSAGVSVTISSPFPGTGIFSNVSGTLAKANQFARLVPKSIIVGSRLFHEYALSSEATLDTDLPLFQPFSPVITATGEITDTLSTATTPTGATYAALVTGGGEIVAECTRRRYLGNIYCRTTRFVPAR